MIGPRLLSVDLTDPGREAAAVGSAVELAALTGQGWTVATSWIASASDERGTVERVTLWLLLLPPAAADDRADRQLAQIAEHLAAGVAAADDRAGRLLVQLQDRIGSEVARAMAVADDRAGRLLVQLLAGMAFLCAVTVLAVWWVSA